MEVLGDLDSFDCGLLDFDEVNPLELDVDSLLSPPLHDDNLLYFGTIPSNLRLEQQPRGGEVRSSVTRDVALEEAVAGEWGSQPQVNGSSAESGTLAAITAPHVHVVPTTDVTDPTPSPTLTLPQDHSSTLEEWFPGGIIAALDEAPQNHLDSLSSQDENMQMLEDMLLSDKELDTANHTMLGTDMLAPYNQPSSMERNPEEAFPSGITAALEAPHNHLDSLSSQHENMHVPQAMEPSKEHGTNNHIMQWNNVAAPNHQPSSSIIQRNPIGRGVGIIGTGSLFRGPLLLNSQPPPMRFSFNPPGRPLPNAHNLQRAPISLPYGYPAVHRPQEFRPLTAQGNVPTSHVFDLLRSKDPTYPSYSGSEPARSTYQPPATAPMLPNTSDHQPLQRFIPPEPAMQRLILPQPAASFRPTTLSPQGGSPAWRAFIESLGPQALVPQTYPTLRDYEIGMLQFQQKKPQAASERQAPGIAPHSGSPPVSDNPSNENSHLRSGPIAPASSPVQGPPTILPKTKVSDLPSTTTADPAPPISIAPDEHNPSSSLAGLKTPEDPPTLSGTPNGSGTQLHHVTPAASTDTLSGNFATPPASATRPPVNDRVGRILDSGPSPRSPKRKVSSSSGGKRARSCNQSASGTNAQQIQVPDFLDPMERWIKQLGTHLRKVRGGQSQPTNTTNKKKAAPRAGRGSGGRRREAGESSASRRRRGNSGEEEKEEDARPTPEEAQATNEHEMNVFEDPNAPEFADQRDADNAAYNSENQEVGVAKDPHIRFYRIVGTQPSQEEVKPGIETSESAPGFTGVSSSSSQQSAASS